MTAEDIVLSLLEAKKFLRRAKGPAQPQQPQAPQEPGKKLPVVVMGRAARRNKTFDRMFSDLPDEVKQLTRIAHEKWKTEPTQPGLNFERINRGGGRFWSVRVGGHHRAVCRAYDDVWLWFWVDTHEAYNKLLNTLDKLPDPKFT